MLRVMSRGFSARVRLSAVLATPAHKARFPPASTDECARWCARHRAQLPPSLQWYLTRVSRAPMMFGRATDVLIAPTCYPSDVDTQGGLTRLDTYRTWGTSSKAPGYHVAHVGWLGDHTHWCCNVLYALPGPGEHIVDSSLTDRRDMVLFDACAIAPTPVPQFEPRFFEQHPDTMTQDHMLEILLTQQTASPWTWFICAWQAELLGLADRCSAPWAHGADTLVEVTRSDVRVRLLELYRDARRDRARWWDALASWFAYHLAQLFALLRRRRRCGRRHSDTA